MSFARYPAYKDSGVEWLGEVPGHWEVKPLKKLGKLITGLTPPTDNPENYEDLDGFPWLRPEDINEAGAPSVATKYLSQKGWDLTRKVPQWSTLICCIGTIGKTGFLLDAASTNQQITAISFHYASKYFYYAACALKDAMECEATGNVVRILNSERLGSIFSTAPPRQEAMAIATFLDIETAKIDGLMAEQRALVALLKEKRQAVISHAVTKGLNPAAPMKDSGVAWLGEVPGHWEVTKIRRLCEIKKRIVGELGFDVLSITQKGIRIKDLEGNHGQISMDYSKYQLVEPGDFAMNHMDLLTGYVDIAKTIGVTSPDYRVFRIKNKSVSNDKYLLYLLQNGYQSQLFYPFGRGSSELGRWRLPTDEFNNFPFPMPPLKEQEKIAAFIGEQLIKFDTLTQEAQTAIALLQERRTALISAAVTGKMDVRLAVAA